MNQQVTSLIASPWSMVKKFLFRFFFSLCAITIVPILSSLLWPYLITWAGRQFYNEEVTAHPSGSGDTLYDYYNILLKIIIAVIIAVVWSILDRKRKNYNTLLYWQEVYIRYYLAFFLLVYGSMKIIKLQFGHPSLSALLIPLGNKSPMGLAWTFMGYSDTYTIFSGVCEALAAAFLIYRKTRTLGAILSFGVMLNVFLMNMSYDIPVKIFSLQLVLLSLFLITLDYKRLVGFFILNQSVAPQKCHPPFKIKWANTVTQVVKVVAALGGIGFMTYQNLESQELYGDAAPRPPMYGIYEVENFIRNNDTIAPMLTDTTRWRYMVLERESANIFKMKTSAYDDLDYYIFKTDTLKREISLLNYEDSTQVGKLRYRKLGKNGYNFEGIFNNDSLKLTTTRTDEKDFLLMNRGFHWVSEYPYNR
jgi:hypothetical protein